MIFIPKSADASAAHPEDHPGIHFHHVDCGCCRLLSPHDLFKDNVSRKRTSAHGDPPHKCSLSMNYAGAPGQVFGPEQWQRHVSWRRHFPDVFVW